MSDYKYEDEENRPEVIAAKAEAKEKVLLARAQLHPLAQVLSTALDALSNFITNVGCFVVLAVIALAIFAPSVITWLTNLPVR